MGFYVKKVSSAVYVTSENTDFKSCNVGYSLKTFEFQH